MARNRAHSVNAVALSLLILAGVLPAPSQDTVTSSTSTLTVLFTFPGGKAGTGPLGVIRDGAGNLYGTTSRGGDPNCAINGTPGCGVVFKLNAAGQEVVFHRFTGANGDDGDPGAVVLRDAEGTLFGTTTGAFFPGTLFKIDKKGKYAVLHNFDINDGSGPLGHLIEDSAGNLYGTASNGGAIAPRRGLVFKIDQNGNETVLHSFKGRADGGTPMGGLIADSAGNFYGTTAFGGDSNCALGQPCGVIFKLSPSGKETVLHTFEGTEGAYPMAGLVRDAAGNLYGTTANGGDLSCSLNGFPGCGVVFKLDAHDKLTVLHTFTGKADGGVPLTDLTMDASGNLFGSAELGGDLDCSLTPEHGGCGVVFKLDTADTLTVLHTFSGGADGAFPSVLIRDAAGNLYGAGGGGGRCANQGCGVLFKIAP